MSLVRYDPLISAPIPFQGSILWSKTCIQWHFRVAEIRGAQIPINKHVFSATNGNFSKQNYRKKNFLDKIGIQFQTYLYHINPFQEENVTKFCHFSAIKKFQSYDKKCPNQLKGALLWHSVLMKATFLYCANLIIHE